MRKRLAALLVALALAGLLLAPAAARDQGFEHRGMPVRNHDRDRERERFFFRHDPRFFGGAAFFVPAPVYMNSYPAPLYYWYCANPPGYYPTVVQCFTAWQAVPVLP